MPEETSNIKLILKEKEHLIDNAWAFRFEPSQPLTWTPGQFMRVELPHDSPDDEGTMRRFTISSAPFENIVQITTRVTQSTFKQALSALQIGKSISLIEMPHGEFVWQDMDMPLVFVAGGIGITPYRSILRQRAHDHMPLNVTLVYGNRTDAIIFKEELDAYAAQDPSFKIHYVVAQPLTANKLAELLPSLSQSYVYISGPQPMVEDLVADLQKAGLPESQLKHDYFPNYTIKNY